MRQRRKPRIRTLRGAAERRAIDEFIAWLRENDPHYVWPRDTDSPLGRFAAESVSRIRCTNRKAAKLRRGKMIPQFIPTKERE